KGDPFRRHDVPDLFAFRRGRLGRVGSQREGGKLQTMPAGLSKHAAGFREIAFFKQLIADGEPERQSGDSGHREENSPGGDSSAPRGIAAKSWRFQETARRVS